MVASPEYLILQSTDVTSQPQPPSGNQILENFFREILNLLRAENRDLIEYSHVQIWSRSGDCHLTELELSCLILAPTVSRNGVSTVTPPPSTTWSDCKLHF